MPQIRLLLARTNHLLHQRFEAWISPERIPSWINLNPSDILTVVISDTLLQTANRFGPIPQAGVKDRTLDTGNFTVTAGFLEFSEHSNGRIFVA